jgi:hypothetical protein
VCSVCSVLADGCALRNGRRGLAADNKKPAVAKVCRRAEENLKSG